MLKSVTLQMTMTQYRQLIPRCTNDKNDKVA